MHKEERLRYHLEQGLQAHHQGRIDSACNAYREALAIAPDHPQALYLFGTALLQLGETERAVEYLERATRRRRDNAAALSNLGQAYFALRRYEQARQAFHRASRLEPRDVQHQLGVATALAMLRKFGDAEALLRKLSVRFPDEPLVWFNLGNALRDQNRPEESLASYRRALQLDPLMLDARNNMGGVLHALMRFEEAEAEYRRCIEAAPDYIPARCNLASVVMDAGRFADAEAIAREIVELAPGEPQAHTLLGAALGHQGRLLEALASHARAAKIAPENPRAVETYAAALLETGDAAQGLRWFGRALQLNAQSHSPHQMLASALLAHGCLADGWHEYGHRPAALRFREKYRDVPLSRALPADVNGKRICLLREQGLGDEIFFLRFARKLAQEGARITYRASNKIRSLLGRIAWLDQVLEEDAPIPPSDVILLVGDLPYALSSRPASPLPPGKTAMTEPVLRDFPMRIAVYWPRIPPSIELTPLEEKIAEVRALLEKAGGGPYVGITWRGGIPPREQRSANWMLYKEIAIPMLAGALRQMPGTVLALQRKPAPGEIEQLSCALGRTVHDFTDLNEDLEGMLALLALLDEYIGVSNTNMHLRAAVGKTARVLVPCPAEWRWMHSGPSSPWFPGFSIYRQSLQGDWGPALAALGRDLAAGVN
jgi:tetratricopeptide (TPR) repeat protein